MKKGFLICILLISSILYGQLPTPGFVYYHSGSEIYNLNTATNVSTLNTILLPPGAGGLAVNTNFYGAVPATTFYTTVGGTFWYYDGTTWVNSGHTSSTVNIGGANTYMYGYEGFGGNVYRYDGTGPDVLILTLGGMVGPFDIVGDDAGNFFILNTTTSTLTQYDPSGAVITVYTLVGFPTGTAGGGFAFYDGSFYASIDGVDMWGTITGTTITYTGPIALTVSPSDMASYPVSIVPTGFTIIQDSTLISCNGANDGTAGVTVTGGTSPYTYSWMPGGMTTSSISGLAPGNYTVTITDDVGADTTAVITITEPAVLDVNINSINPICVGDNIDLITTTSGGTTPYTYNWSSGPTTANINVAPITTTSYSVTVTDDNGCTDNDDITVNVNPLPVIDFNSDIQNGCSPLCPTFTNNTLDVVSFEWSFGDGQQNTSIQNPNHCYNNAGLYDVSLEVTNSNGCVNTTTLIDYINVVASPNAEFSANNQAVQSEFYFTNLSIGASGYLWNFGDGTTSTEENPFHNYEESGNYTITLIAMNAIGCNDTVSYTIQVLPQFFFYIPNSFTPNDNELNSFFYPKGSGVVAYEMTIFNRWGQEIFFTNDLSKWWDGKDNGKDAPQGVYAYRIYCTDFLGKEYEFRGQVNLLR